MYIDLQSWIAWSQSRLASILHVSLLRIVWVLLLPIASIGFGKAEQWNSSNEMQYNRFRIFFFLFLNYLQWMWADFASVSFVYINVNIRILHTLRFCNKTNKISYTQSSFYILTRHWRDQALVICKTKLCNALSPFGNHLPIIA